jgi:hypothetical protein
MARGLRVPARWRVAGRARGVGPYAAQNFPWILIDRALGTLACVAQRSHARRDDEQLDAARLQGLLVAGKLSSNGWGVPERRRAEKAFETLRHGPPDAATLAVLRGLIRPWLERLDAEPAQVEPAAVPGQGSDPGRKPG